MKTDIKMFKRPGTIRSHKTEMITGVNDNETLPLKTELVVSWYSWCLFEVFGYFVSVCVRLSGAPQILTDASADVVGSLVPAPVNLELSSSDIFEFCGFPSLWFMLCLRVVPTCLRSASLCFLFYFDSLCWASLCLLTLNLSTAVSPCGSTSRSPPVCVYCASFPLTFAALRDFLCQHFQGFPSDPGFVFMYKFFPVSVFLSL